MARDSDRDRSSRRHREDADRDRHRQHRDDPDDPRTSKDDGRGQRPPSYDPPEDADRGRESLERGEERRKARSEGRRRSPLDRDRGRDSTERGEERRRTRDGGRWKSSDQPEDRERGRESAERGEERQKQRNGVRQRSPDLPEDCDRGRGSAENADEKRRPRDEGRRRSPDGRDRRGELTERDEEKSKDEGRRRLPEGRGRRRESAERGEEKSKDEWRQRSPEYVEEKRRPRDEGRRRSPDSRDRRGDFTERDEEKSKDEGRRRSPDGRDRRRELAVRGEEKLKDEGRRRSPDGRERMHESAERGEDRSKDVGRRRSPDCRERRRESAERVEEKRRSADDGRRERRMLREKELIEHNDESRDHHRLKGREPMEHGRSRSRSRSREESVEERYTSKKRKEHSGEYEQGDRAGEKRMRVLNDDGGEKRDWSREDDVMKERREERKEKEERRSKDERKERGGEREPGDGKHMRASDKDGDRRGYNGMEERREDWEDDGRSKDERRRKRKGFKEEVKEEQWSDGERKGHSRFSGNVREEGSDARKEKRDAKRLKVDVKDEVFVDGDDTEVKMSRRCDHGKLEVDGDAGIGDRGGSGAKRFVPEPLSETSGPVQNTYPVSNFPLPSKVSSVTTTIENGLINRADEVHGKSSTDGATTSMPGKSGSLSLDALAKAKKALQMQKMLSEKLKKIPMISKPRSGVDGNSQIETVKGTQKVPLFTGTPSTASSVADLSDPSSNNGVASASSSKASDATAGLPSLSGLNIEAVKRAQEVAARMGFRQDPQFAPLINMFPGTMSDAAIPQKPSKAPVLRLDAQGREVDEHGNVINLPKLTNLSTLKVNINKQKKEVFQILKPDLDANLETNPSYDRGLGINKSKLLRLKRPTFQFVEEGKWSRQAEITRFKNQFGEAHAKELKTKQAQLAKAKAEPDINPNLIELSERVIIKEKHKEQIPDTEWWDTPFLPSGKYDDVTEDKINIEKINIYIEHPLPVQPPAEPVPPPPQPLKLTKKENKKLRTQRRLAKERDKQEMIRQGLLEPPKPKVKMSNLMKVLGSEATQDPTKVEMEIRSAAAEREQAHIDRNIARKLTPSERREKKEKKLFDDPNTLETFVTVYKVNSLTHPKARFQVDVNAQENRLSGCAVISDGICVVVVEGGRKSNKRYKNLMLKRIDWAVAAENEDDAVDNVNAPANRCLLIWTGSVAKPSFNRFLIHQCRTEAAARKVFVDAGVPHYWDLAANFSDDAM